MDNPLKHQSEDNVYLLRVSQASQQIRVTVHRPSGNQRRGFIDLASAFAFICEQEASQPSSQQSS